MPLTMNEITPIALCLATADLFDTKRFQANFADNMLLRIRDRGMSLELLPIKRELNSPKSQAKFLDGHKAAILNNLDKILALVSNRYGHLDLKATQKINAAGLSLMGKVVLAGGFDSLGILEHDFRNKILLPVYSLFVESMKRAGVTVL